MEKLARFSVKFPTTIMMVVLAILLLGYISFDRLGLDLLPDLNTPRLYVEVTAGEIPPEELEAQVIKNLESVAARGRLVEKVSSIIRVGRALITVEYDWRADMDESFLDLQKAMTEFGQRGQVEEISVSQQNPNDLPIMVAILSHPEIEDMDRLRRTAEDVIANELIRLPGVASVQLLGTMHRDVEVRTDPYTLQAYGVTIDKLSSAITSANLNMSGGSIVEMGRRYLIRGIGEFGSLDELKNLIVDYRTLTEVGSEGKRVPVYLREVAQVEYRLAEADNLVRFDGRRCIALEIFKESKFSTVEAVSSAHEILNELRHSLGDYKIDVIQDQARFIRTAVTEVEQTGLIGILLAIAVLYVFLKRFDITSIVSLAIPISIVATFNLMYFNDLSLNIMTLGGLALGAGMLVDNAIVVMENIFRHLEKGTPLAEAAIKGAGEVGGAITSATLTTIVVFLPIIYLHGAAGELFREQAWTVAFSLISSLFVALAVIPMLCSQLLKNRTRQKRAEGLNWPGYSNVLRSILKRRKTVALFGALAVVAAIAVIPMVGSEFMPQPDAGDLFIDLTLPEGTSLERTEGVLRNVEAMITENIGEDLAHIYSRAGQAGTSDDVYDALSGENSGSIQLLLNDPTKRPLPEIIARLDAVLAYLPDLESQVYAQQTALKTTLGTDSPPLVIEIRGTDLEILGAAADSIKTRLAGLTSLSNLQSSLRAGRPEINIQIDRTVAAQFDLSASNISGQVRDILSGRQAGQLMYLGDYADISITRPRMSIDELNHILLEAPDGKRVRLDELAKLNRSVAPREITRNNQARVVTVTAHIDQDQPFDKTTSQVTEALNDLALPPDYSWTVTGEEKLRQEAFGNLSFALILAIILVYMVMASQFESLLHPFVILLTIPLAGVGAVFLLLIMGIPFNVMSYIGIILLAGIAVNDSIILVDRINKNRRAGMAIDDAIVNAGQVRIRPIVITSITTILALLPLTIGLGEGAALRAPMAAAVIGGLVSSTALTLIVIPSVYRLMAGRVRAELIEE